jgi:hypothetical protein
LHSIVKPLSQNDPKIQEKLPLPALRLCYPFPLPVHLHLLAKEGYLTNERKFGLLTKEIKFGSISSIAKENIS